MRMTLNGQYAYVVTGDQKLIYYWRNVRLMLILLIYLSRVRCFTNLIYVCMYMYMSCSLEWKRDDDAWWFCILSTRSALQRRTGYFMRGTRRLSRYRVRTMRVWHVHHATVKLNIELRDLAMMYQGQYWRFNVAWPNCC